MNKRVIVQMHKQEGMSLIEMMIAMTIGLVIVGALMAVLMGAGASDKANNRQTEVQTNGRYALDVLKRDIQSAGYYGLTGRGITPNPNINAIPAANECLPGFAMNLSQRVWGTNNGINPFNTPAIANCTELANLQPNTDMIVVRYLSTNPVTVTPSGGASPLTACAAATGAVCFRSAYEQGQMFNAGQPPTFTDAPQQDHVLKLALYYVNRNTVGADGIPSLRRYTLSETGTMTDELVVSGVENMQVQYGVNNGEMSYTDARDLAAANKHAFGNAQTTAGAAADAVAGAVDAQGESLTAWGDVSAVRVWLLLRGSAQEPAPYTDTTAYSMGDLNYTPPAGDRWRREVFTTTVQIRN